MEYILGISAFYHDSAAALIGDGKVLSAIQEERLTRIKHDASFPKNAIQSILDENELDFDEISHVVFYDKPFLKFERLLESYIASVPRGFNSFRRAMQIWIKEKFFQKGLLIKELKKFSNKFNANKLLFSEHHFSHAASAFYPSPFKEAVVLTLDGVGEWATSTVSIGKGNKLDLIKEIHFPHSLGLLYSAFTYYVGFKVNSGEYKLMGLAPYGQPKYKEIILEHLIDVKEDGSFRLNQEYFNYVSGLTMTNDNFNDLFGETARIPERDRLTQFHMDIAASVQEVIEDVIIKITRSLAKQYEIENLCLAGGVALNCVANGKILKDGAFKNLWIQPAAGDAGGALGAALAAWYFELGKNRNIDVHDSMEGSFLGPKYDNHLIEKNLISSGAVFEKFEEELIIEKTADCIKEGKAVGWFQGKMEFGPSALGARSILGDPRSDKMQKILNLKIKFRESFRPFAPSVLAEDVGNLFTTDTESPYMLLIAAVKDQHRAKEGVNEKNLFGIEKLNVRRSTIPAVTHVDYSARIQTVNEATNPRYHKLISTFKEKTGCPLLVNTSFNIRGEPIVCTPMDAFNCFMGTNLDVLVIENYFLLKEKQKNELTKDYSSKFELD